MRPPIPNLLLRAATLAIGLALTSCATTRPMRVESPPVEAQVGVASYYAGSWHGRRTASGERFDMHELTAAHRTLPFGTRVRVTNLNNGREVIVRINDRGPWKKKRVIDVSYAAARKLGMIGPGTAKVRLDIVAESAVREP
jgi:rare lipoprotein A